MLPWIIFIGFVVGMLALDLGVFHRRAHAVSTREALAWTAFWIALALVFNAGVYHIYEYHWFGLGRNAGHELSGHAAALQFFTGYIIEKSLSLDNIFVIALIFAYFGVPLKYQHRVLFWGILGALIMRGIMIGIGSALIRRFDWIIFVFGGLLLITAVRMLISKHEDMDPDKNPLVRLVQRFYPVTTEYAGTHFFTRINGRRAITPLFLVLLVVESSDVLFAVDSIPAIFAITYDPFIVFTSNVFAILGLRSLYFALASLLEKFRFLKISLVFVLGFIGIKMLISHQYHISTVVSLSVIMGILFIGIFASVLSVFRDTARHLNPLADDIEMMAQSVWRQARRITVFVLGISMLLVGIAMIVLPGPAFIVIPFGLAILATEFLWARRILKRIRTRTMELIRFSRKKSSNAPAPENPDTE